MVRTKNLNFSLGDTDENDEIVESGHSKKRRENDGASSSRALPDDISSSMDEENKIPDDQDLLLLRSYTDHVARRIWQGKERGILHRCNNRAWPYHMLTIDDFPLPVWQYIMNSGLAPLIGSAYHRVDKRLLTAFSERWYEDTCTFHLPCGEMTVTLDDVACILHIPVTGNLIPFTPLDRSEAANLLVELLGLDMEDAQQEAVSGSISFLYLEKWFRRCIRECRWVEAARTYLLLLVGSTLFMNKSLNRNHVHYLEGLRHLELVHSYAWGASGLAWLYDQLCEASRFTTLTMGGNMSLLQAWIFEHFPDIGCRTQNDGYAEHQPRIFRWNPHQPKKDSEIGFRNYTESVEAAQVIWQPYDPSHRHYLPFEDICLYSGYIRNGRCRRPYLPERVLRQFGHVPGIPRSPVEVLPDPEAVDVLWASWQNYVLDDEAKGPLMTRPGESSDTYSAWVHKFSHPYLLHTTGANKEPNERDFLWKARMDLIKSLALHIRDYQYSGNSAVVDDIITIASVGYNDPLVLHTTQNVARNGTQASGRAGGQRSRGQRSRGRGVILRAST